MPQLNPSPWFAILLFSWLVILTILPPKITSHQSFNEPTTQNSSKPKPAPWTWPWT
uniref:ATP synthase complex subunit 8 n=1 Tax=Alytes obstetricans pertinax TaxID=171366 RepID=Q5MQQ5_ALYOB|nr:ATP synthase F0 subunit 8 [Alytes obstetricans pertinax]AAS83359.1 ATP synthase F0 subunit 8 [Alytes obstetricans pertinax]